MQLEVFALIALLNVNNAKMELIQSAKFVILGILKSLKAVHVHQNVQLNIIKMLIFLNVLIAPQDVLLAHY